MDENARGAGRKEVRGLGGGGGTGLETQQERNGTERRGNKVKLNGARLMPFVRTSLHGSAEMPKTNEGCYLKRKKTNK